jgi:hypothetical protein
MMQNNYNIDDRGYVKKHVVEDMFRNPYNNWDGDYIKMIAKEVLINRTLIPSMRSDIAKIKDENHQLRLDLASAEEGALELASDLERAEKAQLSLMDDVEFFREKLNRIRDEI